MRLVFEPLIAGHAPDLFNAMSDPAVYRYIDEQPPQSIAELAVRLARMSAGPPADRAGEIWWNHVVRLADTREAIGRLEATIVEDRAEVAYLFGSTHWGSGLATEAVRWLHDRLAERTKASTLWATARPDNARSLALLHRLGYAPVSGWPELTSYDPGDVVWSRALTREAADESPR